MVNRPKWISDQPSQDEWEYNIDMLMIGAREQPRFELKMEVDPIFTNFVKYWASGRVDYWDTKQPLFWRTFWEALAAFTAGCESQRERTE